MGQRSKIDLYGLVDRVITLYNEGKTIRDIEKILRLEGIDISRESIRRKIRSINEIADNYRRSFEEAKALIEVVRDNPNTDVMETAISLLGKAFMDASMSITELEFDDPSKLVVAAKHLCDAQVKVAKFRLDFQKGFASAKKEIMQAVEAELGKHPELRRRLLEVIEGIRVEK